MTITNGYCTLAEFKAFINIITSNVTDDSVIEDCIEAASRYIDRESGRTFYSRTATTRYYDIPDDDSRELQLDDDLQSIDSSGFKNGDGTAFLTANYYLVPKNISPKYAVKLTEATSQWWTYDSYGNTEGVISITGTWGYSSTAPDDIKQACLIIAAGMYRTRTGQGESAAVEISAGGILQPAAYVPDRARRIIQLFKRRL